MCWRVQGLLDYRMVFDEIELTVLEISMFHLKGGANLQTPALVTTPSM